MTEIESFLLGVLVTILIEVLMFVAYCVYDTIVYLRGHDQRMAEINKAHEERMAEINKKYNIGK